MSGLLLDVLPWTLTGTPRDQRLYALTLGLLLLGTLLAAAAFRRPALDVAGTGFASAAAAAWLLSNAAGEGPTLLVVLPGNGVTLADLAAVPALWCAVVLSWQRLRGRTRA